MSWNAYLDNLQAQSKDPSGTPHCDKAAIIGLDGGASWTTPDHSIALKLNPDEAAKIANAFKSRDWTSFQSGGIYCEGQKYQYLRVEDDKIVLGKRKGCGALTMQKSKTAIVIGHTTEGCQQGNTNKAVGTIAEYLEGLNM